jgi:hypothetical protein
MQSPAHGFDAAAAHSSVAAVPTGLKSRPGFGHHKVLPNSANKKRGWKRPRSGLLSELRREQIRTATKGELVHLNLLT